MFFNETFKQLNVENLASGTYMLHIQTNAGLAVKKLVKK
ncbi:T9SS type A sorting domain-containing protein [Paenimyroides viscosum]|uniref:T9SS C-terminal target domain-containing protein n=1 Tax=Paenimyroides viscosum TaxID=2488729 RepID=A0A3P1AYX0_9FLAO|nr:T9SS C-terminal target domain-containing protein [Paenimyroides viscosum]